MVPLFPFDFPLVGTRKDLLRTEKLSPLYDRGWGKRERERAKLSPPTQPIHPYDPWALDLKYCR